MTLLLQCPKANKNLWKYFASSPTNDILKKKTAFLVNKGNFQVYSWSLIYFVLLTWELKKGKEKV